MGRVMIVVRFFTALADGLGLGHERRGGAGILLFVLIAHEWVRRLGCLG